MAGHWPKRSARQAGTVAAWMLDADEVEAIWQGLRELRPDDYEEGDLRDAIVRAQRRFDPTRRKRY